MFVYMFVYIHYLKLDNFYGIFIFTMYQAFFKYLH